MPQVFEGLKVADFSWALVGPVISRYLADHGAIVVRVETSHRPDILRLAPPFKGGETHQDRSGYFSLYNTNKYSIALNLNHPRGLEVARRLILWADVVVENFAPGVMKRWGLDYESISKLKPEIIMISSSNLGQTGPHALRHGLGTQLVSLAGFTHLTGYPDREPNHPFGAYTDVIAPRFGIAALIAALDYRRRTGKGQYLDLSQLETAIHFLSPLFLDYFVNKREAIRMGNRSPTAAPHNAYRCLGDDRWCVIAIETEEEWQRFCQAIGNPPWTQDPRFSTMKGRKEHEEELDRLIEEWTSQHTAEEVMYKLQEAGVPAAIVANSADVFEDPQLRHRNHFIPLEHPEMGVFNYDSYPFKLSKTPAQFRRSPCLGEHTEFVCREILKISDEEFIELLNEGVLE